MIKQHIFSSFLLISILLGGIASNSIHLGAADKVTPPLNTDSTVQVGMAMLHQGEVYPRAAIHLSEEIKFGEDEAYALTPGYYFRTGASINSETYAPADGPEAGRVNKAPGAITLQGSFLLSNDGKTISVITNFYQAIHSKAKGITKTTKLAFLSETIQRSLIYGGKDGDKIKIGYREKWKNITRPSGDVFLEFDASNSNVIEVHGARIEIIAADQDSIRYRVIRSFDSVE